MNLVVKTISETMMNNKFDYLQKRIIYREALPHCDDYDITIGLSEITGATGVPGEAVEGWGG